MARFEISFKASVEKDLRPLPKSVVGRVWQHIEGLKDEPLPRGSVKLAGAEHLYRIRVGDYRIIYGVDTKALRITIHYVRHRRDAYRGL